MAAISKSKVMTRAWKILHENHPCYSFDFSSALSRAWEVEKANIADAKKQAEEKEWADWYNNSENRRYLRQRINETLCEVW